MFRQVVRQGFGKLRPAAPERHRQIERQRIARLRLGRKTEPASVPMGFLAAAASKRLLVEPTKKAFIRKQLESLGLTQATIFPEIDKVAEFIKRTYATPALTASSESKL